MKKSIFLVAFSILMLSAVSFHAYGTTAYQHENFVSGLKNHVEVVAIGFDGNEVTPFTLFSSANVDVIFVVLPATPLCGVIKEIASSKNFSWKRLTHQARDSIS